MKTSQVSIVDCSVKSQPITNKDVPIGTYFSGTIGAYTGLFVQTYLGIIYLDDVNTTWNIETGKLQIKNFKVVDVTITYVQKENNY